MANRNPGPQIGHNQPINPIFNTLPLATTRGHQLISRKASTQLRGKIFLHSGTLYQSIQAWFIYGIIYNYAPILLRNPIRMFSGPKYDISIQFTKSVTHFEGKLLSHSVLQSLAATRRPFKDPNHLDLQELGGYFISGLFEG
ncbi:hypothetical protein O181_000396 [Austropuccinia psidii MF-1]|uniref:Uncharacterized protein n=1 Tax=Austropuccinia psidii MF-1 TaxID=1389203 RepID=A0A9Q3B8H9_9BASI|nr:hypothetical protein [Austropuccinia psidii MF-1]